MARLNINIGTTANDKTGDPLRTAFDKVNQNFVELYAHVGADVQIPSQTNNGGKYLTTNGTTLSWDAISYSTNELINGSYSVALGIDGNLTVPGNITKASGNLEITAENYVIIDSTNGGQIDIGANQSGEGSGDSGPILMGHAGNTLDIQSGKIRVNSAVPTHSTGALNDVAGLVAFDSSYIYYCTADYVPVGGGGSTVELVPNELGQSVNTITIAKGAPPNTNWANLQVSWTLTVNSTTVTVEEITGDADNLYVVVSGFITLPPTGSITFTEPGGTQPDIWKRVAWSSDTW